MLHPHSHIYTLQPSLRTAPVLALLSCSPVIFLLGNSGLPVSWFPLQSIVAVSWCYFVFLTLPTLQRGLLDWTLQRVSRSTSQAITAMDPVPTHFHFLLSIYRGKKLMKRVVSEERQGKGGNMNCWRKSKCFLRALWVTRTTCGWSWMEGIQVGAFSQF